MIQSRREPVLWCVVGAWLAAVAGGLAYWEAYEATPGTPVEWDERVSIPIVRSGREVVMFVHPRCPCTLASLAELRELLADAPDSPEVRVVFVRPSGTPPGWERGELWDLAGRIPDAQVETDVNGAEARLNGVGTSGHVLVYDPDGRLAFSGGITKARGREGDNAWRRAAAAALRGEAGECRKAPVFGCPLSASHDCCDRETDR